MNFYLKDLSGILILWKFLLLRSHKLLVEELKTGMLNLFFMRLLDHICPPKGLDSFLFRSLFRYGSDMV